MFTGLGVRGIHPVMNRGGMVHCKTKFAPLSCLGTKPSVLLPHRLQHQSHHYEQILVEST
eukprot:361488-Amphidinium_carterae.1